MRSIWGISLRLLAVFLALTGLVYPLVVTGLAVAFFPETAAGSLVATEGGRVIGSRLIAQKFTSPRYFASRPSAADYQTVASGASNQGPTSVTLAGAIDGRRAAWADQGAEPPADLLTASGSGLDPHLSPAAVRFQLPRIIAARQLDTDGAVALAALVTSHTEGPQLGFLGETRVNVLLLNQALDVRFPAPAAALETSP